MEKEKEKNLQAGEKKEKDAKILVTSRVLFISVLDKIYLVLLAIIFLCSTYANFSGNISDINYGFWARVGSEILILIGLFILYLFMNWLYKCASKTMLCVTEHEVYKEAYIPFKDTKLTIPLEKITAVSTIKLFWIFRSVIIHQYGRMPLVFWTWNNSEFKEKVEELIVKDDKKIKNVYESRNLINRDKYKIIAYIGVALVAVILLLGIVRFFCYTFRAEKKIAGTYAYNEEKVVLNKNGTCEVDDVVNRDVKECNWSYDKDNNEVEVTYTYSYYSSYNISSKMIFEYDKNAKTISYYGAVYTKE